MAVEPIDTSRSSTTIPKLIPTTVILDHHDSYTRNLLVLFANLFESKKLESERMESTLIVEDVDLVNREGGKFVPGTRDTTKKMDRKWIEKGWQQRVVVINVDDVTWEQFVSKIIPQVSCIILGPGPGNPSRKQDFSWSERLIKHFGDRIPILGLCLGHQGLATTFGGKVQEAVEPRHGQISSIRIVKDQLKTVDPIFKSVPSPFEAVQFNSLVVAKEGLPDELAVIAWRGRNGEEEEIMALSHRSKPLWGVQFHPESVCSSFGSVILSNFLELATSFHDERSLPMSTLPLSLDVRALTTSYKRGLPNVIPDVPNAPPAFRSCVWEQRTVELGDGDGRLPQEVFEGLVKGTSDLGEVWLDSARPTVSPQFSHVFTPQSTWSHLRPANTVLVRQDDQEDNTITYPLEPPHTFFTTLATSQASLKRQTRIISMGMDSNRSISFPIGFVGYFGYEMKEVSMPLSATRSIDEEPTKDRVDAEFAFASRLLTFEHETGKWYATALVRLNGSLESTNVVKNGLESKLGISETGFKDWLSTVRSFFTKPRSLTRLERIATTVIELPSLIPDQDRTTYMKSIEKAKEFITAGESYELCKTTQFRTTLPPTLSQDPYELYISLRQSNPAPYSAYFHLPFSHLSLLSSSPERYMRITREGQVEMKPIKGTVKRCLEDPIEDQRRRESLAKDEKERAENLMIVDLCRNDLLGFCEVGSVEVPKLMKVETYQTVHQLVTSVVGQLTPAVNPFEAVQRAFPPGSMTGAPKLRSLKLLDQLEDHRHRGIYSGVFGYVALDGSTDFSVVIRTLVIKDNNLTLGAGGAITYLSDSTKEWEEVLTKKEAVMKCFTP